MITRLLESDAFKAASGAERLATCNGCGPASLKFKLDKWLGVNLFESCLRHDYDYSQGGTHRDRRVADVRFLMNCFIQIILSESRWMFVRVLGALVFYMAVRVFGRRHFAAQST